MHHRLVLPTLAIASLALAGCAAPPAVHQHGPGPGSGPGPGAAVPGGMHAGMHGGMQGGMHGGMHGGGMKHGGMAVASLSPTQGSDVRGLVMFHQRGDGQVMVHAKVSGLKANAEHGFHVHEVGSCASTDGTSAGGHFNPDGKPHGPQGGPRHAGDMPSLKADAQGRADVHFVLAGPTVVDGPASVVGRSVIVHAMPDDYVTQPTGNAGARLACGVIAGH